MILSRLSLYIVYLPEILGPDFRVMYNMLSESEAIGVERGIYEGRMLTV